MPFQSNLQLDGTCVAEQRQPSTILGKLSATYQRIRAHSAYHCRNCSRLRDLQQVNFGGGPMQAASSSRAVAPDAFSASGLALRRLTGITASARPCSCCWHLQQQQQQPIAQTTPVLQRQSSRPQPGLQPQNPGPISRRKLVIRASGAAGGLGGHGGGRGEPVSLQLAVQVISHCHKHQPGPEPELVAIPYSCPDQLCTGRCLNNQHVA